MSIPTVNLSAGCSILETEIVSMGISATIPQPMSANAPKFSRWVMRAGTISPHRNLEMYASRHLRCAFSRESITIGLPFSSSVMSVTTKQTGRFTLEITAMSRTEPSLIPIAPSSLGIMPFMPARSTIMLWLLSHTQAFASRIFSLFFASSSIFNEWSIFMFSCSDISFPSGKYSDILKPPSYLGLQKIIWKSFLSYYTDAIFCRKILLHLLRFPS